MKLIKTKDFLNYIVSAIFNEKIDTTINKQFESGDLDLFKITKKLSSEPYIQILNIYPDFKEKTSMKNFITGYYYFEEPRFYLQYKDGRKNEVMYFNLRDLMKFLEKEEV